MNRIEEVRKILCRKVLIVHKGEPLNVYLPDNLVMELGKQINQLYEPQPDHTPECIKHKTIFGSIGCTCKPDQSRLLMERIWSSAASVDCWSSPMPISPMTKPSLKSRNNIGAIFSRTSSIILLIYSPLLSSFGSVAKSSLHKFV